MTTPTKASEAALRYFRGTPRNLPCSSVVAAAFKGVDDQLVQDVMKYRGGQHPTGECGALATAKMIRPDLEELLDREFTEKGGSCKCRELRSKNALPCAGCVSLACDVLEQHGEVFAK